QKALTTVSARGACTGGVIVDALNKNPRKFTVVITPTDQHVCNAAVVKEAVFKDPTKPNLIQVQSNPLSFVGAQGCKGPGLAADEVLVHELAHAWRAVNGTIKWGSDMEEFFAMLIANIYMSEKGRGPLRSNDIADYRKGGV